MAKYLNLPILSFGRFLTSATATFLAETATVFYVRTVSDQFYGHSGFFFAETATVFFTGTASSNVRSTIIFTVPASYASKLYDSDSCMWSQWHYYLTSTTATALTIATAGNSSIGSSGYEREQRQMYILWFNISTIWQSNEAMATISTFYENQLNWNASK